MKLLQLCKKFPYPLKDGESIAVSFMSKAMHDLGCEVSLLAMNTTKHHFNLEELPSSYNHYKEIKTADVDNRVNFWGAFTNLFSSSSYHISRFESKSYEEELIKLLKENDYDVIQLETLYLTPYIPVIKKYSKALISYRAHNVESNIWKRITENTSFLPKRIYLKHLTKKLEQYELVHLNDYDYLVTVSDHDLQEFKSMGYANGAMTSPIGLALNSYSYQDRSDEKDICFIGSMDWMPNLEGLNWFVSKVLPLLRKNIPDLKLHIAGRNTAQGVSHLISKEVQLYGEVPCAREFLSKYRIMIVPLLSGSGTRVKILEGLALGIPIVTTSIGLEGIAANHEEHVMIADTPEEFLECITRLQADDKLCQKLSKKGRALVVSQYDNQLIAKALLDKYQLLKESYAIA